ncbi:hypothetical protein MTAT_05990 [Moorella thermoacetica]|uniref:Pit accessory protein n=1 Tax=Neomoorella thermoacetica TaxID=1525 RepID=A0AAC9HHH8_NEOTH|nr:DUF47 family protein [Moorella thermoacetica]AOQ23962.1 Putative pit accessory protein [Moorella thermoacetica]TYL14366.1 hypothetical protein MTAT_05990 [Moorella thermoacetica]
MFRFKGIDDEFFHLFEEAAAALHRAVQSLKYTWEHHDASPENLKVLATLKPGVERITGAIIKKLGETFITPFDREDIYGLARGFNDIALTINSAALKMTLYETGRPPRRLLELLEVLVNTTGTLKKLVTAMRNLKKNTVLILRLVNSIKKYRDRGDELYHLGLGELYKSREGYYTNLNKDFQDLLAVMKWKELYDQVQAIARECAEVARLILGIAVKYA